MTLKWLHPGLLLIVGAWFVPLLKGTGKRLFLVLLPALAFADCLLMTPETVGIPAERIVLGKHSGRHALVYKYRELGHELSNEEVNQIYSQFTHLADRKKHIYEQDLIAMLFAQRGGARENKSQPQEMHPA